MKNTKSIPKKIIFFYSVSFLIIVFLLWKIIPSFSTKIVNNLEDTQEKVSIVNPVFQQEFFIQKISNADFHELKLSDFPSVDQILNVTPYKNVLFVLGASESKSDILKYDNNGKILAKINPSILQEMRGVSKFVIDGDRMFVATYFTGIYEVDLQQNKIVYNYNEENGMKCLANLSLLMNKGMLWVDSFCGVGKINIQTHAVHFYADELGMPIEGTTKVRACNNEIWAYNYASSRGGATHYNPVNDTWTAYFPLGEIQSFYVQQDGVFALLDGGETRTLLQFDPLSKTWNDIGYPLDKLSDIQTKDNLHSENYKIVEQKGITNIELLKDSQLAKIPLQGRVYFGISPLINNTYYLVTNAGIDIMKASDNFPQILIRSQVNRPSLKIFITPDQKYLVAYSIDSEAFLDQLFSYNFIILNLNDHSFFEKVIKARENEERVDNTDATTLSYDNKSEKITLLLNDRKIFEINPIKKTIVKKYK